MKLYELTRILTDLEAELGSGNLPAEEIAIRLNHFGGQFEYKAAQIAKMILNYESDIAQLKAEEDRLASKRRVINNNVNSLKQYLLGCLKELGIKTVNYETIKIAIQGNPYSVGNVSIDDLPLEFVKTIPESREPDKVAILEYFKETGEIPAGVAEISRSQRLVIK